MFPGLLGPLIFYSTIATGDVLTTREVKNLNVNYGSYTISGEEQNPLVRNTYVHTALWCGGVTAATALDVKLQKAGKRKTLWTLRGIYFIAGGLVVKHNRDQRAKILNGVR